MPPSADKIWMNGNFIDWSDAKIHIMSHVIHYGSGVFEGIRAYEQINDDKSTASSDALGGAIFRLDEHIERLYDSAKVYRMEIPYSFDELKKATLDTLRVNKLPSAYIRPLVYRGLGEPGLNPKQSPLEVMIAAWKWGSYLGEEGLKNGISACVSSWRRPAANTFPGLSKASGNYLNSQLVKMEALENGFDEGIALDTEGWVAEGSGENLFLVEKGILYTVPLGSSILPGITRNSVLRFAKDQGIEIVETRIAREFLYMADEIFLTGTAAEVTPIAKIDHMKVGKGKRGPITEKLQKIFFDTVKGENPVYKNWLTVF